MCRKIYIPTIEEYLAERAIKQSVVPSGKLILLFSGQKVAIIPTGRYEDTHPRNTLCRGLILNRDGCEPFTAELNGCKIPLNSITIRHTPKEYAIHADWLKSNSLDWNSSIVHYGYYGNTTQYECKIDVDGEFDLTKLEYNCLCPISVRIGNREYRYNKPILVSVSYNGKIYQVCHKTRTTNNTQDVEESK